MLRQLSVMTKHGYMTLQDTAASCRKLYILEDKLFAASSMFMDFAALDSICEKICREIETRGF